MPKSTSLLFVALIGTAFLLGACQQTESGSPDCSSENVLCVGLVTDNGAIDDKSFNQAAWEGVLRARDELEARVDYVETINAADYAANISLFADLHYDVIVTAGFAMQKATSIAGNAYPDITFIGVDQFHTGEPPNVIGLLFPEDRAGFLAGALAAMMTESGTIGAVLGTDLIPAVVGFKEGYEQGARYIDPDMSILYEYHPGGLETAFTDPAWGAERAREMIAQGADVIFGAGAETGNGALLETANVPGLYCIGVDTDQWETVPEAHPCLLSSAMKLLTPGVYELIRLRQEGGLPSGNFFGDAGLAPFHDFDGAIPQTVKDTLEQIDAQLREGTLTTGHNPG